METQTKTFAELRNIVAKIHKSIEYGYLDAKWKEDGKEDIVLTCSGYYAHISNCIEIDGEYCHDEQDNDMFIWDELDDEYIWQDNSICVHNGRGTYYTHERNEQNGEHEIYYFDGRYIDNRYIERNDLVWDVNGDLRYINDVYYWESDGEYHDEREEKGCIKCYSYKPQPEYFMIPSESYKDSPIFMGIELEIENEKNIIENGELSNLLNDSHLYFKSDGSLDNGFEIVTHPLTFAWIQDNKNLFAAMLNNCKDNGFRSYDSTTCGMHIHLSKKNFGAWHLFRFLKFFQENKDFIVAISQRKIDNLKRWANLEDENNDTLIYKAKKKNGNNSRYVAINLSNSQTIELRIFRGTLNLNSFFKNIEFAHSLYLFTRDNSEISIEKYKEFIHSNSDYSHLSKFLKLKNL